MRKLRASSIALFMSSALCALPLFALDIETTRAITDSVLYDSTPSYYEEEATIFVTRILKILQDHSLNHPKQNLAAFIATMSILDEVQRILQEYAPVSPTVTNNWSGRYRSGWLVSSEHMFNAAFEHAYFAAISARRATSEAIERSLMPYWSKVVVDAKIDFPISEGFMRQGEQREVLYYRLLELNALYFLQIHAKSLFEAAYKAALSDLGEHYSPIFKDSDEWERLKSAYFPETLPSEASTFIRPLLKVFEGRVAQ